MVARGSKNPDENDLAILERAISHGGVDAHGWRLEFDHGRIRTGMRSSSTSTTRPPRFARHSVISVDTKKKGLVGDFKNADREWQPTGNVGAKLGPTIEGRFSRDVFAVCPERAHPMTASSTHRLAELVLDLRLSGKAAVC